MKHSLFKDSVVFATSRYVLLGLSLIRNFFVAKFLGPADYGMWVVIGLILTYGDQTHLGLRHAGDKEIPYYRGQGKEGESSRIANSIFGGVLWLSALALVCLVFYAFILGRHEASLVRYGILISAFIIVTDQVNRFYLMILRTRHEFFLSSKVETGFEVVRTILVSTLAATFHFFGAIIGLFIASFASAVYFMFRYRRKFIPRFGFRSMKPLFALGLPLSATGLLYVLILNLDRLVGAFAFGKMGLGVYGMAALIAQVPVTSSQGISSVIYPRISEYFGEGRSSAQLSALFAPAMTGAAFIAPLLVTSIFFIARFLVPWLLPAYWNSIEILFLLSYGVFFLCLVPIPAALLMAVGRNVVYLRSEVFTLVMIVGIYALLFFAHPVDPSAVALITSASFFFLSTLVLYRAYRNIFELRGSEWVKEIAKIYLPSLYSGVALVFISHLLPSDSNLVVSVYFWQMLASLALYYLIYSPMVYLLERHTGIVSRAARSLLAKGGKVL